MSSTSRSLFVLGAAFSAIVTAIVDGIITPLIAAIFSKPNLSAIQESRFATAAGKWVRTTHR